MPRAPGGVNRDRGKMVQGSVVHRMALHVILSVMEARGLVRRHLRDLLEGSLSLVSGEERTEGKSKSGRLARRLLSLITQMSGLGGLAMEVTRSQIWDVF